MAKNNFQTLPKNYKEGQFLSYNDNKIQWRNISSISDELELSDYAKKSDLNSYLNLETAETVYAKKDDIQKNYVTYSYLHSYTYIDNNIITIGNHSIEPLSVEEAESTYAKKDDVKRDFVTYDYLHSYTYIKDKVVKIGNQTVDLKDYTTYAYVYNELESLKNAILGDDLEETFNTLRSVYDWTQEHGSEYADLVTYKADKSYVDDNFLTLDTAETVYAKKNDIKKDYVTYAYLHSYTYINDNTITIGKNTIRTVNVERDGTPDQILTYTENGPEWKTLDNSGTYVTYTYLNEFTYINDNTITIGDNSIDLSQYENQEVDLSDYITYAYLHSYTYIKNNKIAIGEEIVDFGSYVTYTYLGDFVNIDNSVITVGDKRIDLSQYENQEVDLSGYVTYTYLNSYTYIKDNTITIGKNSIDLAELGDYVTYSYLHSYTYIKDHSVTIGDNTVKTVEIEEEAEEGQVLTYTDEGLVWRDINLTNYPTYSYVSEYTYIKDNTITIGDKEIDLDNYVTYSYLHSYTYINDNSITIGENTIEPLVVDDEAEEGQVLTYTKDGLVWKDADLENYPTYAYVGEYTYIKDNVITIGDKEIDLDDYVTYTYLGEYTYVKDNVITIGEEKVDLSIFVNPDIDLSGYVTYSYLNSYTYIVNDSITIGENTIKTVVVEDEAEEGQVLTYTNDGLEWRDIKLSDYPTYAYVGEYTYIKDNTITIGDKEIDLDDYVTYSYLNSYTYIKEGSITIGSNSIKPITTETTGTNGQVLTYTNSGAAWQDMDLSNFPTYAYVYSYVYTSMTKVAHDILGEGVTTAFDTLKEVEEWINEHGTGYSGLLTAINDKADKTDLDDYVTYSYLNSYTYIIDDSITIGENTIKTVVVEDEAEEGQVLTYTNEGLEWKDINFKEYSYIKDNVITIGEDKVDLSLFVNPDIDLSGYVTYSYLSTYTYIKDDSITIGDNTIEPLVVDDEAEEGQVLTYTENGLEWKDINLDNYITYSYLHSYTYIKDNVITIGENDLSPLMVDGEAENGQVLTYSEEGLTWTTIDLEGYSYIEDNVITIGDDKIDLSVLLDPDIDLSGFVTYSYLNSYTYIKNDSITIGENTVEPLVVDKNATEGQVLTYTNEGLVWKDAAAKLPKGEPGQILSVDEDGELCWINRWRVIETPR